MALVSCSECQKEISDNAVACPHCGAPARPSGRRQSGLWKWLLGVPLGAFILLIAVGSCAGNTPDGKERSQARGAIEQCWKEQERKSLAPGTARFVAETCEKMERDFRSRWGRNP